MYLFDRFILNNEYDEDDNHGEVEENTKSENCTGCYPVSAEEESCAKTADKTNEDREQSESPAFFGLTKT